MITSSKIINYTKIILDDSLKKNSQKLRNSALEVHVHIGC